MNLLLIPVMSFLCRACGASWNRIPQLEIAFVAPFGLVAYLHTGIWWIGVAGWIVSYVGMQLGHGNFYQMKGVDITNDKPEDIEKTIRPYYKASIYHPLYSWVCMGAKGLIIGLGAFPYGLALVALWPLSYWLSFKYTKDSMLAEWLAGGAAGLIIWASL